MSVLTTRFTVLAAVALVVLAQAVVAPASCCVLSAALFDGDACCRIPGVDTSPQACCRHHVPAGDSTGHDCAPSDDRPVDCPWCSFGPKVSLGERVAVPSLDAAGLLPAVALAVENDSLTSKVAPQLAEPFHRTAPAICAWLCVWRN